MVILIFLLFFTTACAMKDTQLAIENNIDTELKNYVNGQLNELFDCDKESEMPLGNYDITVYPHERHKMIFEKFIMPIAEAILKIQGITPKGFNYIIYNEDKPQKLTEKHRKKIDEELSFRIRDIIQSTFYELSKDMQKLMIFNLIGGNNDLRNTDTDDVICICSEEEKLCIKMKYSKKLKNLLLLLPTSIGFYDKIFQQPRNLESAIALGQQFYSVDRNKYKDILKMYYDLKDKYWRCEKNEYQDVCNGYKKLEEEFKKDSDLENLLSTPQLDRIKEWVGERIQKSNKHKEKLLMEIQDIEDSMDFSTRTIVLTISIGIVCWGLVIGLLSQTEQWKKEFNLEKQ